eukprot:COSAG06_NODE_491_length_15081_cov_9.093245_1_plen_113_part_10
MYKVSKSTVNRNCKETKGRDEERGREIQTASLALRCTGVCQQQPPSLRERAFASHAARHSSSLDHSTIKVSYVPPVQPSPYTTQHNTTQHNTTQHNTTQHNTTQHNTTQHNTT